MRGSKAISKAVFSGYMAVANTTEPQHNRVRAADISINALRELLEILHNAHYAAECKRNDHNS